MGSSPLTRGKRGRLGLLLYGGRLIPTHAGKTLPAWAPTLLARAHPRSRGENIAAAPCCGTTPGSSPLARGKRSGLVSGRIGPGLIPARAGKTRIMFVRVDASAAHPRSRGENWFADAALGVAEGSSPLTRGKPWTRCLAPSHHGLIPAHAGKTYERVKCRRARAAHPRSRGENSGSGTRERGGSGSSPLTRGKRTLWTATRSPVRLIPAHAGKTMRDRSA